MFFQALNDLDGLGVFLGDEIRCTGGFLKRLEVVMNDASGNADTSGTVISARSAQLGDVLRPGDVRRYQWWYRDTNNPPCGTGVNDSNTSSGRGDPRGSGPRAAVRPAGRPGRPSPGPGGVRGAPPGDRPPPARRNVRFSPRSPDLPGGVLHPLSPSTDERPHHGQRRTHRSRELEGKEIRE